MAQVDCFGWGEIGMIFHHATDLLTKQTWRCAAAEVMDQLLT
jgi:hypothetical protein